VFHLIIMEAHTTPPLQSLPPLIYHLTSPSTYLVLDDFSNHIYIHAGNGSSSTA
jgi:hypothetical protein